MRPRLWLPGILAIVGLLAAFVEAQTDAKPGVVSAWATDPFTVRVALDRTISEERASAVVGRAIEFDESRPTRGSAPVTTATETRGSLRIAAARVSDDGRTLILTTDPHPRAATYTVNLPLGSTEKPVAVSYDLTGVEASWIPDDPDRTPASPEYWPSLDPGQFRASDGPDVRQEPKPLLSRPGKLALETLAVLPRGPVTLALDASAPLEVTLNGEAGLKSDAGGIVFRVQSTLEPFVLSLTLATGKNSRPPTLRATFQEGNVTAMLLRSDQLLLPWTPPSPPTPAPLENVPDLSKGDPIQGAAVFKGETAKCASCHKVRGEGAAVGPDLSSLVGRDRAQVYRDIAEPSARINPDYVPYTIALKDGRILVGTVRAEGRDAVRVIDTEAKVTVVARAEIDQFRPGATSIMPVGLAGAIGEEKLRDLIAYLTTAPAK